MANLSKTLFLVLAIPLLAIALPCNAQEKYRNPVEVIAANTISVQGGKGRGLLPIFSNRGLGAENPEIERAIVVIHGQLRNAGTYFQSALAALERSGGERDRTLVAAPQFLAEADSFKRPLPADVLRWSLLGWEAGEDAVGPAPVSSFEALDSLLHRFADRALFPKLRTIVVVGHSGGGQVVQRYAIFGKGEADLAQRGIHLRYVAANASSYAYFDTSRPDGAGQFAAFPAQTCKDFNHWRYGMEGLPPYDARETLKAAESDYARRDVVYLLGTQDTDPQHRALDKSCMAEAQGSSTLARGEAYFAYLRQRHPHDLAHRLVHVEGVGHNGDRMLTSGCGLSVIFDRPGCGSS